MQQLMLDTLMRGGDRRRRARAGDRGGARHADRPALDPAFIAEAVLLPSEPSSATR
jgi:hypothetical protein